MSNTEMCYQFAGGTDYQDVKPYIINIGDYGKLSPGKIVPTEVGSHLDELVSAILAHIQGQGFKDILLYGHGGLTDELNGIQFAKRFYQNCLNRKIYPVFLIWESGFLEILEDKICEQFPGLIRDRELMMAGITDGSDYLIEETLKPLGTLEWSKMKENAMNATSRTDGAIRLFLDKLSTAFNDDSLKMHLIGHSAGSILHSGLVKYWSGELNRGIETCSLLAPAITIGDFVQNYFPALNSNKIRNFFLSTMTDDSERKDNCLIYRKSLLYWVSNSFESERDTPILGMQKFTRQFYGDKLEFLNPTMGDRKRILWELADTAQVLNPQHRSYHHGGFGDLRFEDIVSMISQGSLTTAEPSSATRATNEIHTATYTPKGIMGAFDQGQVPRITLINKATVWGNENFQVLVQPLQKFVDHHFGPIWGVKCTLEISTDFIPGCWAIVFLDDADSSGALGYHNLTPDGFPRSNVFTRTTLNDGKKISVTACHELAEMLIDPAINLTVQLEDGRLFAYETCDAVENTEFNIDGIAMSNFVYPSWFEGFRQRDSSTFDHINLCNAPFEILSGGYMPVYQNNDWGQIFGSEAATIAFANRDHRGHRSDHRGNPLKAKPQISVSNGATPGNGNQHATNINDIEFMSISKELCGNALHAARRVILEVLKNKAQCDENSTSQDVANQTDQLLLSVLLSYNS